MMCTVTMSADRTERLSLLLQLRSVPPTVIAKTGSLVQAFISRGQEKGTCIGNASVQCLANFVLVP